MKKKAKSLTELQGAFIQMLTRGKRILKTRWFSIWIVKN